jgi:hypothetical protein
MPVVVLRFHIGFLRIRYNCLHSRLLDIDFGQDQKEFEGGNQNP